ncbi:MAG TPA: hypothetical protein VMD74_02095 [Candidatus Methylomirabilis sp.]|nr:hypothetical protein [Candidatus Methylomirabilis sp.]
MDLFGSFELEKGLLVPVYETVSLRQGELADFLVKSNFFASVLSGILAANEERVKSLKVDLNTFLNRAKEFKDANNAFENWWPGEKRRWIIRQAMANILSGSTDDRECFGFIIAIVEEVLKDIDNYEKLQEIRQLVLR